MRSILNISLSKELARKLDSMVKKGRYSTKSEFLRNLIREKIEEEELWISVQKSDAEFKAGKGKLLKSLKDCGEEIIFYKNDKVYRLLFHGGIIKK